jgi:hypothetical protein
MGQLTSLEISPDEVIIIGHVRVINGAEDVTTKTTLNFNFPGFASASRYRADSTGFLYMKLAVGKSLLRIIECNDAQGVMVTLRKDYREFQLPADYATFECNDPSKVYYIGDITIDVTFKKWTGPTIVPITVDSLPDRSIAYFKKLFPNNSKKIVAALLSVKHGVPFPADKPVLVSSLPDSCWNGVTRVSKSSRPGFFTITGEVMATGLDTYTPDKDDPAPIQRGQGRIVLFSASTLKIDPDITLPVNSCMNLFSPAVLLEEGNFYRIINNAALKGFLDKKMTLANPIEVDLSFENGRYFVGWGKTQGANIFQTVTTQDYIVSGPKGCTLQRTTGKNLILVEGDAFLFTYPFSAYK